MNVGTLIVVSSTIVFVSGFALVWSSQNKCIEGVGVVLSLVGAIMVIPILLSLDTVTRYHNLVSQKFNEGATTPISINPPATPPTATGGGTRRPASLTGVRWHSEDKKKVTLPTLPGGQKWVILHDAIAGTKPNGEFVYDTLYEFDEELKNPKIYLEDEDGTPLSSWTRLTPQDPSAATDPTSSTI